jgi:hypothetical protein
MDTNLLLSSQLSIIPIKDKIPTVPWKEYQTRLPRIGELSYNGSIGLICGPVSGNVQAIDIDSKNDSSGTLIARIDEAIFKNSPDITQDDIVVQRTPSGGWHLIFKCSEIAGNEKLALTADRKTIIETRATGGYIAIAPTPGYEILTGSLESIPTISPDQREALFTACRSLNEHFEEVRLPTSKTITASSTGLPPWEDYNERADVPALLQAHGWTYLKTIGENQHYCRPDKTGSTSGTWNGKTFYSFTSSTILDPSKAYSPAALFAYLECNKDFTEAGRKLYAAGYGERVKTKTATNEAQNTSLFEVKITPRFMEKPKQLFDRLWCEGEVTNLFAENGAGKSFLAFQIGFSIATGVPIKGFTMTAPAQPVVYFDFELTDFQLRDRYPSFEFPENFYRVGFTEQMNTTMRMNLTIDTVIEEAEKAANTLKSRVLIFDNQSALAGMVDSCKGSEVIRLMSLFWDLKKRGYSILILDHTRKPMFDKEFKMISINDMNGSKQKSNLVDNAFSLGKSSQGEDIRYLKSHKVRTTLNPFPSGGVAVLKYGNDPIPGFHFQYIDKEFEHVNDRTAQIQKMSLEGKSQSEIATRFNISQAAVSKNLNK